MSKLAVPLLAAIVLSEAAGADGQARRKRPKKRSTQLVEQLKRHPVTSVDGPRSARLVHD